jgi:hypothetical protein
MPFPFSNLFAHDVDSHFCSGRIPESGWSPEQLPASGQKLGSEKREEKMRQHYRTVQYYLARASKAVHNRRQGVRCGHSRVNSMLYSPRPPAISSVSAIMELLYSF